MGEELSRNLYNVASYAFQEAFQKVKATSDTALKTGDLGLFKHRQATQPNRQNTTTTQQAL